MSSTKQKKLTILVKRFIDLTWYLFLFVAVLWPLTVVVVGLSISSDPEQRHTDVSVFTSFRINSDISNEMAKTGQGKSELLLSGRGDLNLNNTRSRLGWYLSGAISEVLLFVFMFGLMALRKLFTSLLEGNAFIEENAGHIRRIGYVFIAFNIISPVLQYLGGRVMLQDIAFNVPGILLYPSFEFDPGGVFAGLAMIVLSGVLREAVSIHQEQSLTI